MKERLLALAARVDALSLRERVMAFAAAAAAILFAVHSLVFGPLLEKEKALRTQLTQARNHIAGIDAEITSKVQDYSADPDARNRARLEKVKAEIEARGATLRALQKGLVAPEKMASLLEAILAANGRLTLVALKTLPVGPVSEASYNAGAAGGAAPKAPAGPASPITLLYRHGVEMTVRGNYLDMVSYMSALESMPAQLLWGSVTLEVEEYPNARLTLTLYTLSMDRKWMKL